VCRECWVVGDMDSRRFRLLVLAFVGLKLNPGELENIIMTEALVRAAMPTKVTLRRCAFQSLPFASRQLPIHHSHNEPHHSHPLAHPRLTAITAHMASTLCFTLAQTTPNTTNTFATPRRPLSQY
jgi:hypothetical protein